MIICYAQPGKAKSRLVLEAFAAGYKGRSRVVTIPPEHPEPCDAAFYGTLGIERLITEARLSGRDWWFGDNAFFDRCRTRFFRFARNAFQLSELATPDHARLKALGVAVKPWQQDGRHIVIVEQSAHFLRLCGAGDDWLARMTREIKRYTSRTLRVRPWRRDKDKAAAVLGADLAGAWALVTHMSAAANEALLAGVPVFTTGPCAAMPMASGALSEIERPKYPDGREDWAAGLAASQWTVEEIRAGSVFDG